MKNCIYIILNLLMLCGCQSGFYKGPPSDHFNGQTFFNPGENQRRSLSDIYEQAEVVRDQPWPSKLSLAPYKISAKTTWPSNTIKITFINHATVLIQAQKLNILTDPIWSLRASPFSWIGPARVREPGMKFSELPHIDVVLISHNHYDHLDMPTIERLEKAFHPLFIVPLGNKVFLSRYKIHNVVELDWWQKYKVNNVTITFLPAQHWSARWLTDVNRTLWGSYGVEVADRKIYFAGDTGYSNNFKAIYSKWGRPDFAVLPIGAYEPRSLLKQVHLNPQDAVTAHKDLASPFSMGIHFGTFQLSSEPIDQPQKDLARARQQADISDEQFFTLSEGQSWLLKS